MTTIQLSSRSLSGAFRVAVLSGLFLPIAGLAANVETVASESFRADTRGFGDVKVTLNQLGTKGSLTTFEAQDAEHAKICASKRLADLLGFGDIKEVTGTGLPGTVLELAGGGSWLLGVDGSKFHEIYAPNRAALERLAKERTASSWQPAMPRAYPRWLDCFDNAGPGVWVGGGGAQYTLPSDFEWLQERKLTMCTLSPNASRLMGPGLLDTSIFDWHTAMAAKYDIPYRVLHFPGNHPWLWNREPLPYVRSASDKTLSTPFLLDHTNSVENAREPVPVVDAYVADSRRKLADHLQSDPNYIGMHGCLEIPDSSINLLANVAETPGIKELWHSYLTGDLGLSLAAVGQLHKGNRSFYKSWSEVEVPRPIDFTGWNPKTCLDLRGTWQMHEDLEGQGATQEWFDPAKAPSDWVEGDGNDPLILIYGKRYHGEDREGRAFWMRRSFQVTREQIDSLKYLQVASASYHSTSTPVFDVWINGKKLARAGDAGQYFPVGDVLRVGENEIVLNTQGAPIVGYCFLGPDPLRKYLVNMTEAQNRLWFDGTNFDASLRIRKIEADLQATRAADPNRPLKLMALIELLDLSTPLCEKYGAYHHDTGGAGGYWAPMTGGRLARSHGVPFSSEQGGPPVDAAAMQTMMTFYLMYGNDALDMVFAVSHYRDNPGVAEWFEKNIELFRCIGKMQMPMPKIAVLRSARASRMGFREPWNWDVGRGPLQAVGRNFAYIEVPDILNGVIDQFPVVMDAGSVLLTEEEVAGIKAYVSRGGTFVAQHHSGQHTPAKANAWPLATAFGLTITPKYITEGKTLWEWPLGRMKFSDKQALIASLSGKEIDGSGVAIDYLGKEHTGALSITGNSDKILPVSTWPDSTMAIAEVKEGRGRFILLGTPFYTRMRDVSGVWVNDGKRSVMLDEFLTAIGVPRDSWTGSQEIWAEIWRSKNGVFDLYPVARMVTDKKLAPVLPATVSLRRESPVTEVVDIGALGHPKVPVAWKDGRMTLPTEDYDLMKLRMYAAPRADIGRAAFDWFAAQSKIWRALPKMPEIQKPVPIAIPQDLLALKEGWTLKVDGQPDRVVSSGAFGTLGLPEETKAVFEKTVAVPADWKGRNVSLVFDAENWFWGILPQGRLFVNGKAAAVPQPIRPKPQPSFSTDVTEAAATGSLTIRLEVDGSGPAMANKNQPGQEKKGQPKPNGVTGLFILEATTPSTQTQPLPGPWFEARAFNRLQPVKSGEKADCLYLETRFKLADKSPEKRLFLASPEHLGFVMLNGCPLLAPSSMKELNISGLAFRDGRENVLRWVPAAKEPPRWNLRYTGKIPQLNLEWR